jgi:hypothetical protein
MDDGRDQVILKNPIKGHTVPQVRFIKGGSLPRYGGDTLKNGSLAVGKIVNDNRIISSRAEGANGVAPDVSGPARHKYHWFFRISHNFIIGTEPLFMPCK